MPGIQFWNRFLLFFQQPSRYAETPYTKYLTPGRIHLYTFFQIIFFLGVFFVQNTASIAIIFPFMTLLCIPGRLVFLSKFFEGWELLLLDGEDEQIEHWIALKEGEKTNDPNVGDTYRPDPNLSDEDPDVWTSSTDWDGRLDAR